jgi:hypothetical protein
MVAFIVFLLLGSPTSLQVFLVHEFIVIILVCKFGNQQSYLRVYV